MVPESLPPTGTNLIKIVIAEPWDLGGTTLYGMVLKKLKGSDNQTYLLLRLSPPGSSRLQLEGAIISNRFARHSIDDLLRGEEIDVGIAKVVDDAVYEQEHFTCEQVKYCAIGTAILEAT